MEFHFVACGSFTRYIALLQASVYVYLCDIIIVQPMPAEGGELRDNEEQRRHLITDEASQGQMALS